MESRICGYFFHSNNLHDCAEITKAVKLHLKRGEDTEMISTVTKEKANG